jgi:hypothetical protein
MRFINYFGALALCLYLATSASALVTRTADCSKGKTIASKLNNIVQDESYEITVIGTCTENVNINDFEGVSLTLVSTTGAIINGVATTPPSPVVLAGASRRVTLKGLTINPVTISGNSGNFAGALFSSCTACVMENLTVNAANGGITWVASQGVLRNPTVNVTGPGTGIAIANSSDVTSFNIAATSTVLNSLQGIVVDGASRLRLVYDTPKTISGFINGIRVVNHSSIEGGGLCATPVAQSTCLTLSGNTYGMRVTAAQVTAFVGVNFSANKEGIRVENGSVAMLGPALSITGSLGGSGTTGAGILATHSSHVSLQAFGTPQPANVINTNAGRGIALASGSTLQINGQATAPGQNNITNLACDASSLITGTSGAVAGAVASCTNQNTSSVPVP